MTYVDVTYVDVTYVDMAYVDVTYVVVTYVVVTYNPFTTATTFLRTKRLEADLKNMLSSGERVNLQLSTGAAPYAPRGSTKLGFSVASVVLTLRTRGK